MGVDQFAKSIELAARQAGELDPAAPGPQVGDIGLLVGVHVVGDFVCNTRQLKAQWVEEDIQRGRRDLTDAFGTGVFEADPALADIRHDPDGVKIGSKRDVNIATHPIAHEPPPFGNRLPPIRQLVLVAKLNTHGAPPLLLISTLAQQNHSRR
jgi:hypothetical protein